MRFDRLGCASRLLRGRDRRDGGLRLGGPGRDVGRRRSSCSPQSLARDDQVALEATGPALAIARILRAPRRAGSWSPTRASCARSPRRRSRPTSSTRARCASCWRRACCPRCGRRMSGRARCAGACRAARSSCASARAPRTRSTRCWCATCKGRPPVTRRLRQGAVARWLAALELPADERETVDGCLRQIDFLDAEIALIEREIAEQALASAGDPAADDRPRA